MIKIVNREGTHARYFVYDDAGREIAQVDRDISREIAEAKRKHVSLVSVLAAKHHVNPEGEMDVTGR